MFTDINKLPGILILFIALCSITQLKGQTDSLKIMTFNIWVDGAGVNDGVQKVFNEIQSADPDVVLLQEADGIALSIAAYLDWYVYNSSSSTAIISPYPITEIFQDQSSNSFIGARIQMGSNPIKDIIVWSIHLGPYPYGPYEICFAGVTDSTELVLIDSLSGRLPQINSLVSTMTQHIANADSIPIFVGGDFNTPSHQDYTAATASDHCGSTYQWPVTQVLTDIGMIDAFREIHLDPGMDPGNTWSPIYEINSDNNLPEPQDRIDLIFYKGQNITNLSCDVSTGNGEVNHYPNHLDNDWPSDHAAVVGQFEVNILGGENLDPLDIYAHIHIIGEVYENEDFTVEFENAPGIDDYQWISVFNLTAPGTEYLEWYYTGAVTSGSQLFSGLQPGDYEFRIFRDNGYSQAGVYLFSVIDSSSTDISYNINEFLTDNFKIYQPYPNPFNPVTNIRYDLPKDALVNITIYDMMGRKVSTLVSSRQTAGYKTVQWNATNDAGEPLSAGLYLYMIEAGQIRQMKKMVLLK